LTHSGGSQVEPRLAAAGPQDAARRLNALAHGLEFTKRCAEARTLTELGLLLTNDIGSLVEFDRAFLLLHLTGQTELVAVSNTAIIEKKSRFLEEAEALGTQVASYDRGFLVAAEADVAGLARHGLGPAAIQAVATYLEFAKCSHLFCMPLNHIGRPMGHLFLEFNPGRATDETRMVALLSLAPLLAQAVAHRRLLDSRPKLVQLLGKQSNWSHLLQRLRRLISLLVLLGCAWFGLFRVPAPIAVGGEAEVTPWVRHMAFARTVGLVEKVFVAEGQTVRKGETVAMLESRELDHRIAGARRQVEVFEAEMELLQRTAAQGQASKLADRSVVALKRQQAEAELQYLEYQRGQLAIISPVAGTVATRDVAGLSGKKLNAGEPFCEIVTPDALAVDVLVPEDRIWAVKPRQTLTVYLDTDPRTGHDLIVEDISPKSEALPRLGNVFRVRAAVHGKGQLMVGMKGIGRIAVRRATLAAVVWERVLRAWHKLLLHLS
jgi:hypothetical protein